MGFLPAPSSDFLDDKGFMPEYAQPSTVGFLPSTPSAATLASPLTQAPAGGFGLGSGGGTPDAFPTSPMGLFMQAKQRQMLLEAGLPTDLTLNPDDPTFEDARSQIEAGIARLATYSPAKAQQLQAHMAQNLPGLEEHDKGFGDQLKELGGDILGLGMKALQVLARPAQIIPELMLDDEDDPWYEDIAQALSGNSDKWGSDVMDHWGVKSGPMKAIGGFVFDVAMDPITWMTFGTAGVGRKIATASAGKAMGTHVLRTAGGVSDDAARRLWKQLVEVKNFDQDAGAALAAIGIDDVTREVQERALITAHEAMRAVQGGSLKKLPAEVPLRMSNGSVIKMPRKEFMDITEGARATALARGTKTGYMEAKGYAGAMGGIRFRMSLPGIGRYISPAISGTESFGFQMSSRFFRGMSGMVGLNKAISKGHASMDDLDLFLQEGFLGLKKQNPELAKTLGWTGLRPASILNPLSDRVGRVTAGLSPHAKSYRGGGLPGLFAADTNRASVGIQDSLITDWMRLVDDKGRPLKDWDTLRGEWTKHLDPARSDVYSRFDDTVPLDLFTKPSPNGLGGNIKSVKAYFAEKLEKAKKGVEDAVALGDEGGDALVKAEDELAALEETMKNIRALKTELSPEEIQALFEMKRVKDRVRVEAAKHGVIIDDVTIDLNGATSLTRKQARRWNQDSNSLVRDTKLFVDSAEGKTYTMGTGRGYRAVTKQTDGAVEVGVRLRNPLIIDRRAAATASDETKLAAIREAAEKLAREESYDAARQAADPRFLDDDWARIWVHQRADELTTEALSSPNSSLAAHGGKPHDGIITVNKDGSKEVTVFNDQHIKLVDNEAPHVIQDRGYASRQVREEVIKDLFGEEIDDLVYGMPRLVHKLERKYADYGIDEAERLIREDLNKTFATKGRRLADDVQIFERDPLKTHMRYLSRMARGVAEETLGYNARRLSWLGDINPYATGGITSRNLYRFSLNDKHLKQMAGWSKDMIRWANKYEHAYQQAFDYEIPAMQRTADELDQVRRALDDFAPGEGTTMLAEQAKRYQDAARKVGAVHTRELRTAQTRLVKLQNKARRIESGKYKGQGSIDEVRQQIDDTEALIRDLRAIKGGERYTDAAIAREGTARTKVVNRTQQAQAKVAKLDEARKRHVERLYSRAQVAIEEYNKVDTIFHTNVTELKAALVTSAEARSGFAEVGIKGLEGLWMPKPIAEEFATAWKGLKEIGDARKAWRQWVMGPWKKWATIMSPGFHVRNSMGAWFNNWMGGVTMADYEVARRIRYAMRPSANKWNDVKLGGNRVYVDAATLDELQISHLFPPNHKVTYEDLGHTFSDVGINRGHAGEVADLQNAREKIEQAAQGTRRKKGALSEAGDKYVGWYGRGARKATETVENFHRTAAMIGGLKQTGGDLMGARSFTMLRQGDYTDLTETENFIKDLLPFYKWLRTNTPYQIHNLFENPAKQLATVKATRAAAEAQDLDHDELTKAMPTWMRNLTSIPVPDAIANLIPGLPSGDEGLAFLTLDLPLADLQVGASDFVSQFLPTVRPFLENMIGKTVFTGGELSGRRVPLAGWASAPGIKHALAAAGLLETDVHGQLTISDKVQNIASIIPIYSRFRNFMVAEPGRVKQRTSAFASFVFGTGLRVTDMDDLTQNELHYLRTYIEPEIAHLRQLGVTLPDKTDLAPEVWTAFGYDNPDTFLNESLAAR